MSTLTLDTVMARPVLASPAPARSTPSRVSEVRLTSRGRLVVLAVGLLIAFVIGVAVSAGSVATEHPGTPAPTRIVQVHEGDTLWDIASGLGRGGDVRSTMAVIQQLNAMSSSTVQVGQRLVVPAS